MRVGRGYGRTHKRKMNSTTGTTPARHPRGTSIQLTITSLILLCVSLIAATGVAYRFLDRHDTAKAAVSPAKASEPKASSGYNSSQVGPWGELLTLDIDIEQPSEYVSFAAADQSDATWTFPGTSQAQARSLMLNAGLTAEQADAAMADGKVENTADAVIVKPGDELVLALPQDVREKFYAVLAKWPENKLMREPYHLQGGQFEAVFTKNGVNADTIALVKKLSYSRGGDLFFSDLGVVIHGLASADSRIDLLRSLTYQSAVLARLKIGPDTDVDKMIGYWSTVPGVHTKDLRPLVESISHTAEGGTISLVYFLPAFARERLYTFPLPPKAGETVKDCHWSALNFLNEEPDDKLLDNAYASKYVQDHFYPIGQPSQCGDLIFLIGANGEVIHSAVHIAGDVAFTKNGANYAQPWILMRMDKLLKVYSSGTNTPKALYYRRNRS